MSAKHVRFNVGSNKDFQSELRKRVDSYFKENNISKSGNWKLYIKTFVMFSAYICPFLLITFNVFDTKLSWFILAVLMGFGMAGIGMSVMHDANHGSYSKNDKLNGKTSRNPKKQKSHFPTELFYLSEGNIRFFWSEFRLNH